MDRTDREIDQIAHEILEKNSGTEDLVLIGIRRRVFLAKRIAERIEEIEGRRYLGILDITLYRDD